MLWVYHFQTVKQFVQRAYIAVIVLTDFTRTKQLHYHREVLLIGRSFIFQIEHQRQKQHTCRRIPERVLRLASFRRGRLKEIGYKHLHIVIVSKIDKWVVTMAAVHIDKVKDTHLIASLFKQSAHISHDFTFRV